MKNTQYFDSSNTMQMYMEEIGKIPLLSADDEIRLFNQMRRGGEESQSAREAIAMANLKLVVYFAKKYVGRGVEFEDLNAMGVEGLYRAVDKYDHEFGYKFSTYASWWIIQAITRGIADEGETVRIPVHMSETICKVRKAQKAYLKEFGKEPTVDELALRSGVDDEKVKKAIDAQHTIISFDANVGPEDDSTLADYIRDENAEDPGEAAVNSALKEDIENVLKQLSEKESRVLRLRYGMGTDKPMTLEEIANLPEFGITRERVRQIEAKAIGKIRCNPKLRRMLENYAA